MAHVGQEVGLERRRFLRQFFRAQQALLASLRSVMSTKVPMAPPGVPSGRTKPCSQNNVWWICPSA
jgi:hypothetical protein